MTTPEITTTLLRQYINGLLLPLNVALLLTIAMYLYASWLDFGTAGIRRGWTRQPGVAVACVLWWIFFAIFIRSATVWTVLRIEGRLMANTPDTTWFEGYLYVAAGLILIPAMLRSIFLFTPKGTGHWGWILSAIIAVLFVLVARHF